jgi:hypothetical protein
MFQTSPDAFWTWPFSCRATGTDHTCSLFWSIMQVPVLVFETSLVHLLLVAAPPPPLGYIVCIIGMIGPYCDDISQQNTRSHPTSPSTPLRMDNICIAAVTRRASLHLPSFSSAAPASSVLPIVMLLLVTHIYPCQKLQHTSCILCSSDLSCRTFCKPGTLFSSSFAGSGLNPLILRTGCCSLLFISSRQDLLFVPLP